MKFKVGDKVEAIDGPAKGFKGKVVEVDDGVLVDFKGWMDGHNGNGQLKTESGWWFGTPSWPLTHLRKLPKPKPKRKPKAKPKRVNTFAWACVTARGRVRYIDVGYRDIADNTIRELGDRIARCRLVEITKKRKVQRGA